MNQSLLEENACDRRKARENASEMVACLVLVLLLIGSERGTSFTFKLQRAVKYNQSKREITFDTQLKTALYRSRISYQCEVIEVAMQG